MLPQRDCSPVDILIVYALKAFRRIIISFDMRTHFTHTRTRHHLILSLDFGLHDLSSSAQTTRGHYDVFVCAPCEPFVVCQSVSQPVALLLIDATESKNVSYLFCLFFGGTFFRTMSVVVEHPSHTDRFYFYTRQHIVKWTNILRDRFLIGGPDLLTHTKWKETNRDFIDLFVSDVASRNNRSEFKSIQPK